MRHALLALAFGLAVTFSGCSCKGGGGDDGGNLDGGFDAGPKPCMTHADCASEGPDFVCDPQEKVCMHKCMGDSDCTHVASGICISYDGTCRPPCNQPMGDYCSKLTTADGGMNLVCRADTGRCVPRCYQDDDCSSIVTGTRCTETTGQCTGDVHACNPQPPPSNDTDCNNFFEFDDYCFNGGIGCRCVVEPNDAGLTGVCHRRNRPCSECTADVQCGTSSSFDPMGACLAISGDTSGKKYCLYSHNGPCGCGYFDNGSGFCAPQTGRTCADPGCADDKDCPGGSVCNKQRCACEPRCRWDFAAKTTAAPGCPPGQTCWVDNENLDPNSIYYGSGRCRPPCTSDMDCAFDQASNPHGGAKLKCAAEQLTGGGLSDKRCRANGDCMDNLECPVQPDTSIYFGYCDRGTFVCKLDCRIGTDPITGKPYNDCRSPYGCKQENGINTCVLKSCVEQGGAAIACNAGEYCCGEDKNFDDAGDPCPPPSEWADLSGCYKAPSPPFCWPCSSADDCQNLNVPGWLTSGPDNCSPIQSPSCAKSPMLCFQYVRPGTMGPPYGVCAPATHNDNRRDMFGRSYAAKGCPATFGVRNTPMKFINGDDFCNDDSQCQLGGIDAGRCAPVPTLFLQDGGHPKGCVCTVGATGEQCPNKPDAGVISFCQVGIPGETQVCLVSVNCQAPTAYVFSDAGPPQNGCGF